MTIKAADGHAVIQYLTDVINWYRHLAVEAQIAKEPDETLFYAADAQTAGEILQLGFDYARAQTAFNAQASTSGAQPAKSADAPELSGLAAKAGQAQADVDAAKKKLSALKAQLVSAPANQKNALNSQISATRGEIQLAQDRADAMKAMADFSASTANSAQSGSGMAAQIDELQRSIPSNQASSKATVAAAQHPTAEPSGIIGYAESYIRLRKQSDTLSDTIAMTQQLTKQALATRAPLIRVLQEVDTRGIELSKQVGGNATDYRGQRAQYERLIELHKLAAAAVMPISKQQVLLGFYTDNLSRWRDSVDQRAQSDLRGLIIRLSSLAVLLALIAIGGYLWRFFTVRFVEDPRRRHQLLAARRLALWFLVIIVLLFNFSNQFGAIATVMGFAAAGVAVALQNVILSVAGYFFLVGRFGIRAGDRVQIGNVVGDVISIGLVKLTLMELTGTENLPSGRVVVYSNAIVFQPNGNFFKQAPGMSFIWSEVRLTLAPDCDYRLAEKRLLEAVNQVFARYRDQVQGDFRHLESDLHMLLDNPRPTSRMNLTSSGLEIIIRYPATTRSFQQISDEVTRRLLDAIRIEPSLHLVPPNAPNIQPLAVEETQPAPESISTPADGDGGAHHGDAHHEEAEPREPAASAEQRINQKS